MGVKAQIWLKVKRRRMALSKREQGLFPRYGMAYTDRFRMTVKDFGREILIELNRGTAKLSDDGKKIIINYTDSPTRKIAKVKKSSLHAKAVASGAKALSK